MKGRTGRKRLGLAALAGVFMLTGAADTPPRPRLFEPMVFNFAGATTYKPVFSRDGRTAFFTVEGQGKPYTILTANVRNGRWGPAQVVGFSGRWPDAEPFLSPDGRKLFFASQRPDSGEKAREDFDLFVVERKGSGWGEPRRLGPEVNSGAYELHPSVTRDGTLYFVRYANKADKIWRAPGRRGGGFGPAELLPAPVNIEGLATGGVFVAPDESFMLFEAQRPGGPGSQDVFITRRRGRGWAEPARLTINTPAFDTAPSLSADGRRLFVAINSPLDPSVRLGQNPLAPPPLPADAKPSRPWHIYWVPAAEAGIGR